MVWVTGFEPATSPSRTVRATELRHTQIPMVHYTPLRRIIKPMKLLSDQVDEHEVLTVLRELEHTAAVPGDVVEFGCYVGTTSVHLMQHLSPGKTLHVYDSFAGLPEKTPPDLSPAGEQFRSGELAATKKQLITNFKKLGLPLPVIHKGWFDALTTADVPEAVSFAFLDGDYYESVRTPLELLRQRLSPGAIIVVDDYANEALPGAAKAVDEWLKSEPRARLVRVEHSLCIIALAL